MNIYLEGKAFGWEQPLSANERKDIESLLQYYNPHSSVHRALHRLLCAEKAANEVSIPETEKSMRWFRQMEIDSPKLAQMIHFCHAAYNQGHGTNYTLYEFLEEVVFDDFMVHGIGGGENSIDVEEIVVHLKLDQLYDDYNIKQSGLTR